MEFDTVQEAIEHMQATGKTCFVRGSVACDQAYAETIQAMNAFKRRVETVSRLPLPTQPEAPQPPPAAIPAHPTPILGDDPGSLDRFRRVFAAWDFSEGTY